MNGRRSAGRPCPSTRAAPPSLCQYPAPHRRATAPGPRRDSDFCEATRRRERRASSGEASRSETAGSGCPACRPSGESTAETHPRGWTGSNWPRYLAGKDGIGRSKCVQRFEYISLIVVCLLITTSRINEAHTLT